MLLTARTIKPNYPAAIVDRPRLYRQLDRWQEVRGIAIHAPAGYGKSSLVSRWIDVSDLRHQTAWLSLVESDADPRQFVYGCATVLDHACPGAQAAVRPILEDSQGSAQRGLERLLNVVAQRTSPEASDQHVLLVLDDLHRIQSPEVYSLLISALEYGPQNFHLLMLARWRTELALARLIAHEQIVVLSKEDLRFTQGEVRAYLLKQDFSPPSESEVSEVAQRSEGWVTALKLSVLSSRRRDHVADLIAELRGDREWLAEFLTDEVLKQQTPELRSFLLRTSILDEFDADLCGAVSGVTDSYAMLAAIARADLFLIQLGSDGGWFRYHHLFQELLQHRLKAQTKDVEVAELHRRAATWLIGAGHTSAAVRHLLAAGDAEDAGALVESRAHEILFHNPYGARRMFDLLPASMFDHRPGLAIDRCRLAILLDSEKLPQYVQQAERTVASMPTGDVNTAAVHAQLRVLRAGARHREGDTEGAIAAAELAQASRHELDDFLAGALDFLSMHLHFNSGKAEAARECAKRALAAFARAGFGAGVIALQRELATRDMRDGKGSEAAHRFETLLTRRDLASPLAVRELALAYLFAAENAYWLNDLERAHGYHQHLVSLAERLQDEDLIRLAFEWEQAYLAAVQATAGMPHDAAFPCEPFAPDIMPAMYLDVRTRALIAAGRGDEAWRVVEPLALDTKCTPPNYPERIVIPYLHTYIMRGFDLTVITPVLAGALKHRVEIRGRFDQLRLLALSACQRVRLGDEEAAAQMLNQALHLSKKTGYIRVLLDLPDLASLIQKLDLRVESGPLPEHGEHSADGEDNMLTLQELKVLQLLALDRTYQQIAEELFISINTVRTHVRHIYRKLGVRTRDQAITSACRDELLATK